MRKLILAAFLGIVALPAAAQQELGYYYTTLGPADMYNSDGVRLTNICQIVQQDRANYHRFGRPDAGDEWDAWFGTPEARRVISQSCVVPPAYDYIRRDVLNGVPRYVFIQIFGSGGRVTSVVVNEGGG